MLTLSKESEDYINKQIEEFAESIDKPIFLQIKDILNKYFGEDNNQIIKPTLADAIRFLSNTYDNMSFTVLSRGIDESKQRRLWGHLKIYIKIGDVTITNGSASHDIKDLWVRFNIGKNGEVSNLQGLRSTMSYQEAKIGYMHSHLPARAITTSYPPTFESFCLGSGEINQVILFLAEQFDPINFTLFCLHLKNFLEWESIDGVPHIFMEDIETGNNRRAFSGISSSRSPTSLGTEEIKRAIDFIKDQIAATVSIDILRSIVDPFIVNDEVSIAKTERLEIWLGDIIRGFTADQLNEIGISRSALIAKKDNSGNYIHPERRGTNTTEVVQPTQPMFEFKGQPIYLTIKGLSEVLNNDVNHNNNVYANPQISREFLTAFSADFAEVCYRNQKAIKDNSIKNLLQTTGSNLLAVC